jgi:hypothetical protein
MLTFSELINEERLSGIILSISKDIQIIRSLIKKRKYLDLENQEILKLLDNIKQLESEFLDLKHNRHKNPQSCHLDDFFNIHDKLSDIIYDLESLPNG